MAHLQSYYFGFSTTKNESVDEVLEMLCMAGKAYHHTEEWNDVGTLS